MPFADEALAGWRGGGSTVVNSTVLPSRPCLRALFKQPTSLKTRSTNQSLDCEGYHAGHATTSHLNCPLPFPLLVSACHYNTQSLDCEGYIAKKQERRLDKAIKYVLVSGKKALADAGLDWTGDDIKVCRSTG
jgi:3-oxoacyl-(acyl-carrier-protein) synthase